MARNARVFDADAQPLWKRLLWLVLYWLGGVAVVGALAVTIRFWLGR